MSKLSIINFRGEAIINGHGRQEKGRVGRQTYFQVQKESFGIWDYSRGPR